MSRKSRRADQRRTDKRIKQAKPVEGTDEVQVTINVPKAKEEQAGREVSQWQLDHRIDKAVQEVSAPYDGTEDIAQIVHDLDDDFPPDIEPSVVIEAYDTNATSMAFRRGIRKVDGIDQHTPEVQRLLHEQMQEEAYLAAPKGGIRDQMDSSVADNIRARATRMGDDPLLVGHNRPTVRASDGTEWEPGPESPFETQPLGIREREAVKHGLTILPPDRTNPFVPQKCPRPRGPQDLPHIWKHLQAAWESDLWRNGERLTESLQFDSELYPNGFTQDPTNSIAVERHLLAHPQLWWVSADMCDIVFNTLNAIPDETLLSDLPAPARSGFVVFETPHFGLDAYSGKRHVRITAFAWGHVPSITHFNTQQKEDCLSLSTYRYVGEGHYTEGFRKEDSGMMRLWNGRVNEGWVPLGRSDWPVEDPIAHPLGIDHGSEEKNAAFAVSSVEDRKLVAALWALIAAKSIAETRLEKPSRQVVKQHQRKGTKPPKTVNVVYLRRPDSPRPEDHVPGKVNWSHRWIVSAHPRLQPCGPGRKDRRLIMVGPYQKGPGDKPLVVKETVRALVR